MRILWVKAGKLLPLDSGGKLRSYNILRHLAHAQDVHLLSYYGGERDINYEAQIVRQLPGSEAIYTGAPEGGAQELFGYLRHLPDPVPFAVSKFTDPRVSRAILKACAEYRIDVAVSDFLSASRNFPSSLAVPTVLFQHNVETVLWNRLAERTMNPARKIGYTLEARKMARYERRALAWFHHVIAVSRDDRAQMLAMYPNCQISVVPTGVDTAQYHPAPPASSDPPLVVFIGSMDWEPNIDAVEFFCWEIWPEVIKAIPRARFQIVGRNPHPRVQQLANSSVEVTGTVSSISDHLRYATVVAIPIRIGGGTRLKIFEAMAMGKAVISTSIGAEGLDVKDGRDLAIADAPQAFAATLTRLLQDAGARRKYERAAAELAARYDWSEIARQFAGVLQGVVADSITETTVSPVSR
jgi:polysaccharide biosynthesis protein PslH